MWGREWDVNDVLLTVRESGVQQHNHAGVPDSQWSNRGGSDGIRVFGDTKNTNNTSHLNALDRHNNLPPYFGGKLLY